MIIIFVLLIFSYDLNDEQTERILTFDGKKIAKNGDHNKAVGIFNQILEKSPANKVILR